MSQSSLFDPLPTGEDFLLTGKEHIRRGYVVERFVISAVVVVLDEAGDGALELPRIIVVFRLDDALTCLAIFGPAEA